MPVAAMPATVVKSGQPALYVVLGGVLVLGALVGAGLYIGRAEAQPGDKPASSAPAPAAPTAAAPAPAPVAAPAAPAPEPTAAVTPAPSVSTPPAAAPSATTEVALSAPAAPASAMAPAASAAIATAPGTGGKPGTAAAASKAAAGASTANASRPGGTGSTPRPMNEKEGVVEGDRPPPGAAATQTPAGGGIAIDFDELETDVDQLLTRASAVNSSLDSLKREQSRQGLGLRGDIASRQESMNLNLTRAREAVQQRNVTRLQRFKALAEGDIEALEKFLGR